ncbi:MAG: CotH kinase family protein [Acutalibacteraceae bacterium]
MKSKISQATKKSVSLLLAILMMFSMLTVAMSVTVNAATYDTMYLCGKINGQNKWDSTDYGMTLQDGIWSITLDLKNGDAIKVRPTTSNWNIEYGKADNDTGDYSITEDANYTVSIRDGAANKTGITVVKNVVSDKYTVTVGSTTGGTVELVSTSPAAANTEFEFKVKANDGYQIGTVTLSNGTTPTKGSVDSNGYTHYTFTMPPANVTINATFTSTETPSATYFIGVYNSSDESKCVFIPMDPTSNNTYVGTTANDSWVNGYGKKFKITTKGEQKTDLDNYCVQNVSLTTSDSIASDKFTLDNGDCAIDSQVVTDNNGIFVIEYDPTANSVKLWTKTDYDAAHGTTPTACITIKPTSLTNMGVSEVAPITATHSATCAGTLTWAVSEGEDVISIAVDSKDPYTYKVTALKPGTAKVKVTCSVTGESVECPVEVKRLPFAETGRIYAYAGRTAPTDATLVSDAWIAAEKADNQLSIYGDNSSSAEKGAVKNYPTLGAASEKDLCIYLPSSAATDKVTLYNASAGDLKVGEVTIASGDYGEVSYTDGESQNITLNGASKTLKIYRSNATGALYLNNTGTYAGMDSTNPNVPKMITQLYSGKDTGELGKNSGNYGAYTDKDGNVKFAGVSKVKGRGNSTWRYTDKKSFNVTFTDAFKAFGFNQGGKKYSLLANYKDPSLSRNKILYQLGKDVFGAKYVPKTATVDLYMNGLYMGSYLMCQKVEVGSKEVVDDVDDATLFEELYTDPANQTADIKSKGFSFLMELDSNASDGSSTTDPDYYTTATDGKKLTIKEPEYGFPDDKDYNESVDNAIKEFVKSKYNQLKEALNNKSITYEQLNAIVDVDSLTRYFLLNEFAKNYDIGVTSTYFVYKCTLDAEGKVNGGKFYASPVWDLDVTASNCEKTNNYYSSYEKDWTNDNSDWNVIMKAAFGNPVIQNAADAIWTPAFYTTLTNNIKTLATNAKNDLEGSYENNFRKWTYPYDFNGQGDNVQAHTSLEGGLATFNVSNAEYTKTTSYDGNSYSKTAREGGQIDFLEDWLLSRAAWMTKKYNDTITSTTQDFYIERYYDATGGDNGISHYVKMDYDEANGTYSSEVNFAENKWTSSGNTVYRFGIVTEDGASRTDAAKSVTAYKGETAITNYVTISDTTGNLASSGVTLSNYKDVDLTFADSSADLTYIVTYKPGTGNVLDGKITITKKSTSTTSDPKVSITGSTLTEIKVGAKVNITATVTPVMISGVAQAGDYTVTLLRNGSPYASKTVTFSELTLSVPASQTVTFTDVPLETEKDVFTATVSATIGGQSYSASAQTPVKYINAGARDKKIYFDPSGKTGWKGNITAASVVTMTVGGNDFPMYIDSEEKYALEKGVFRTEVDADTLALMQKSSTKIKFTLGTATAEIDGSEAVKDGSIYTLTDETETGKNAWSDYNVAPVEEYPFGAKTYEEFVTALNANQTQRILYFDNSVSGWHNLYFYSWNGAGGVTDDTLQMKKIPNTDVWYYDFGTAPTADFLFKDRSGNAFGTDYQQTVDLVGSLQEDGTSTDFVRNAVGDGEEVYVYFTSSYQNNKNPIFITSTFYNCTPKNATDNKGAATNNSKTMLKYRAFNTEWKNYAAVLASAVKTKSVEIYFDLHNKATEDSITIYHNSINNTAWKFPAEFTRLNRIGTSTIYRGTVALPYYTDNNELKRHFNFTKFVIGDKEYAIAENGAGQPTAEFINTGKIWFEINKNVNVSTGASAKTALAATGANVSIVDTGYEMSGATVYFQKPSGWSNVRMAVGYSDRRQMIAPTSNDGDIYKFANISYSNYDGFFFIDVSWSCDDEDGDYYKWHDETTNVTDKIQVNNPNNILYKLSSGSSGAVTSEDYTGGSSSGSGTTTTIYIDKSIGYSQLYVWSYNSNGQNKKEPLGSYIQSISGTDKVIGTKTYTVVTFDLDSGYTTFNLIANGTTPGKSGDITGFTAGETYTITSALSSSATAVANESAVTTGAPVTPPSISLTAAATTLYIPQSGSATTTLTPNVQNAGDATVSYTVNDEAVTLTDDTFVATVAGIYTVKASITVNGTTYTSDEVAITVKAPTVTINPVEALTLSGGEATATLSSALNADADSATVTYSLVTSTTDATVSGTTFTATKAGTYTVKASITVGGNTYTDTTTITVNDPTPVVKKYYFFQFDGSKPDDDDKRVFTKMDDGKTSGTYIFVTGSIIDNKFKITLSNDKTITSPDKVEDSADYSVSKRTNFDVNAISFVGITGASASLNSYGDIIIDFGSYSVSDTNKVVIEYTPDANTGLDGSIKIYSYAAYYGTQPVQSITLSATATSIDRASSSLTSTISAVLVGLTGPASFSITSAPNGADLTGLLTDNGNNTATFTATNTTTTGSYVITATAGGVTKNITINVTDSSVSVTDYCNIISYNTASANFSATNGGTVSDIKAVISNGYYDTNGIDTGYTEVQSDGSVTLYYALVNGTTGPVVKFTATTNHANEGTGDGQYSFDGWEKDGTLISDAGIVTDKTVTDSIKTVNTVNYVANWSLEQYVKFTFTYNYKDQDYKTAGMEYNPGNTSDYSYEVTVMVSQADASDAAKVQELYLNYQPKITSDYYTYAFDKEVSYSYTAGALTGTASSTATNTAKVYKLLVKNSVGDLVPLEKYSYFYQNLVQLTATPAAGKTIEWKNNGLVIGYGNNIAFRITDTNTIITYSEVDATVASDRTVLHQPTYEFFVENNVEKVRFNFLVENKVQDLSNVELGVLYFFTDKDGANSTVYPGGADIPVDLLKAAAVSGATGINKKVITYANFKGEYIFNAKISNTEANKQKYLRVYSYIKNKTTGEVILSDTITPVIASISYATAT